MKRHKKSKLVTYFFSFLPGAGFMYRGYMKRGFSYLTLFLCSISILSQFSLGVCMVIPVLIWFYAFFDQINTLSIPEEEQGKIEDKIVMSSWMKKLDWNLVAKNYRVVGGGFLILGSYLLMKVIYGSMIELLPSEFQPVLQTTLNCAPKLILSCVVFYLGNRFLQGNVKLENLFKKPDRTISKQDEDLIARTNVVYYMNKGDSMEEENKKIDQAEDARSFQEILGEVSREKLLEKAKQLLQDDIYQSIHIENAAAVESVKVEPSRHLEKASEIEKAAEIEKVEVEKCPHSF